MKQMAESGDEITHTGSARLRAVETAERNPSRGDDRDRLPVEASDLEMCVDVLEQVFSSNNLRSAWIMGFLIGSALSGPVEDHPGLDPELCS
jgi:hypothetical protein